MSEEYLAVTPVPRNIGDDFKVFGVPLSELVLLFGAPMLVWILLKFSQLDTEIPFPACGSIMLSSFCLWVLGPAVAAAFILYKKGNPDFDMMCEVIYLLFPKSYNCGRDVEYRPYLSDPIAPEVASEPEEGMRTEWRARQWSNR